MYYTAKIVFYTLATVGLFALLIWASRSRSGFGNGEFKGSASVGFAIAAFVTLLAFIVTR